MTTIEAYIYPQPAERRVCSTCRAQMVNVGRDVWVCPKAKTEPRRIGQALRASIRATAAERVEYAPF
jgi:hypothetical protein